MNIIITGANGVIGRELSLLLSKNKNNNLFLMGKSKIFNDKKSNIKFYKTDLLKKINYSIKADILIHCASNHYFSHPNKNTKELFRENIKMSENIKKFCNKNKVEKLIFFSSIDVYGSARVNGKVFKESDKLKPENWYAKSKLKSEKIFLTKKNYFQSTCLRIPGVIGVQKYKEYPILSKVIHEVRLNNNVPIYNSVEKFNNILDVFEIYRVIKKIINAKRNTNLALNIAASKSIRYSNVMKLIISSLNSKSKLHLIKSKKKSFTISNQLIQSKLNIKISSTENIIKRICKKIKIKNNLAIFGGKAVRSKPMPPRRVFDVDEFNMVKKVFQNSWKTGIDFGFQGKFEDQFTKEFCKYHGGGYADAVSSGGSAIYIALKSLELKPGADVIVSPTCNPGGIMPIAIQNVKMIIPDSYRNSFNISAEEFEKSITPKTQAAVLTHLGGHPIEMDPIMRIAKKRKIKIVEDCSQAHGATYKGRKVGTFGDIAAFSNGYSKQLAAGGTAGIVFTKDKNLYWKARSIADRGKPFIKPNFNFRMTTDFLFPSHNLNADEISCAIGSSVLKKLPSIISKRHQIVDKINKLIKQCESVYDTKLEPKNCKSSYFFHTIGVDLKKISTTKINFAKAIASEGVLINYDYRDITSEWKWSPKYSRNLKKSKNAINFRDTTFNLLFNEKYQDKDINDIIKAILKVEKFYLK